MSNLYSTLTQVKNRLDVEDTSDDELILDAIEDASRLLDSSTHRRFYPSIETRDYEYDQQFLLRIEDGADLLTVTTLTTENGNTAIAASDFYLMAGDSYNVQPYTRIAIKRDDGAYFQWTGTPQKSQQIIGVWGFHSDYANAYVVSSATVNETFTDSDIMLTVSDGTQFERGQTTLIESEWLYISDISTDDLTVKRAMNGSTAAAHSSGTAISVYKPMRDVERVTRRFALWLYKQNEAPFTFDIQTSADGSIVIPPNAPPAVHRFARTYRRAL